MPSKAAIKLEGGDGDSKGGLCHFLSLTPPPSVQSVCLPGGGGGGALGYFLSRYVLPGTPNWHPVLKKISPKIDTPF